MEETPVEVEQTCFGMLEIFFFKRSSVYRLKQHITHYSWFIYQHLSYASMEGHSALEKPPLFTEMWSMYVNRNQSTSTFDVPLAL